MRWERPSLNGDELLLPHDRFHLRLKRDSSQSLRDPSRRNSHGMNSPIEGASIAATFWGVVCHLKLERME